MTQQKILDLINQMLFLTIEISLPILGTALVLGLLVSIFQAATQINEATLSFLPKVAGIIIVIVLMSPWFLRKMSDYTKSTFEQIATIHRQK
jgi:flagellar biosynthetic protein FliQ